MSVRLLLDPLTRPQLFEVCDTAGVSAPRALRKAEIVARIVAAQPDPEQVLAAMTPNSLSRVRRSLGLAPRAQRRTILRALGAQRNEDLPTLVESALTDLRAKWWSFAKARRFVHRLELRGTDDWKSFCAGNLPGKGKRPEGIPVRPHLVYEGEGWKGYRDWLGLGPLRARREDPYWPFAKARGFVRSLRLRSNREWRAYCRNELRATKGTCPDYVPSSPESHYSEWISWGDWLGNGRTYRIYARPFEAAREFAQGLHLKSEGDWRAWCRGERPDLPSRPPDVPTNPGRSYRKEWEGWGDWLGTGRVATRSRTTVTYLEAQKRAQDRGIAGPKEWKDWWRRRKPKGVPADPPTAYPEDWESWHAFLGVDPPPDWLAFDEAREFVRALGLASGTDWRAWCRGDRPDLPQRPDTIPSNPHRAYSELWTSWGDWLGTGSKSPSEFDPLPWKEARSLVRGLGFRNQEEFKAWVHGRAEGLVPRPPGLPTNPSRSYKEEWTTWGDFLGNGNLGASARAEQFWAFRRARTFVRKLKLRNEAEWRQWLRGERPDLEPRPPQIPASPAAAYQDRGWKGFGDWLGTGYVHHSRRSFRSFEEAWEFSKALGLRSKGQWERWCKRELPSKPPRPKDIPTNPQRSYKADWPGWSAWLGNS